MRGAFVEGDARFDGLRTHVIGGGGSFQLTSSVIEGDLSFLDNQLFIKDLAHGPANSREYPRAGYAWIASGFNLSATRCDHLILSGSCFAPVHGERCAIDKSIDTNEQILRERGVILRRLTAHHFELRDPAINRDLDVQDTRVRWWHFPGESASTAKSNHRSFQETKAEIFKGLLSADKSRNRSTYASIERSLLAEGDIGCAEQIRKVTWFHMAEKLRASATPQVDSTGSAAAVKSLPWSDSLVNRLRIVGYELAGIWGYGQFIALISLFACVTAVCLFCVSRPGALEPSLAWVSAHPPGSVSASAGDEDGVPGRWSALLVTIHRMLPIPDLPVDEKWTIAPGWLPIMAAISTFAWIWWALILLGISMKLFRALGVRGEE